MIKKTEIAAIVANIFLCASIVSANPPARPSPIRANALSTSDVFVQWTSNSGEPGNTFEIFRDGVSRGNATTTSYTDTGSSAGTFHRYFVVERNGSETSAPSDTVVATTKHSDLSFVFDGVPDFTDYYIVGSDTCSCGGQLIPLYAAVRGNKLYLATRSPGAPNESATDRFIFISDTLDTSNTTPAPWAKTGRLGIPPNKPFVGAESTNNFVGWFNAGNADASSMRAATSDGYIEAIIDLVSAFGYLPDRIYVAVAAYQTQDGGSLVWQTPNPNGIFDDTISADEFRPLDIVTLRDENSDGLPDRLDPALDFRLSVTRNPNRTNTLTVSAVPGRTYYFRYNRTSPFDPYSVLGSSSAHPGDTFVTFTDFYYAPAFPKMFYRVEVVTP